MTALAELLAALGVTVTGVRRAKIHIDGRPQPDDNAWRLELPRSRFGLEDPAWLGDGRPCPAWSQSKGLRAAWPLNRLAELRGRDPALTPLIEADGRTVLRLLHEGVERTGQDHE